MSLFEILGEAFKVLLDLVPRFAQRPASTEYMVVDGWLVGAAVYERPVLFVPVLDRVEYYPRTEMPVNSDVQSITSADGESVSVEVGFTFRIYDVLLCREMLGQSYTEKAAMTVRACVRDVVSGHTFYHLASSDIDSRLHVDTEGEINEMFSDYGMVLDFLCIEEVTTTRNFRHYGLSIQAVTE